MTASRDLDEGRTMSRAERVVTADPYAARAHLAGAPRGGPLVWLLGGLRILLAVAALGYLCAWAAFGMLVAMGRAETGWVGLLREFTLYLFLPLLPLLLAGIVFRARAALLLAAPVIVLFLVLYGGRLLPKAAPAPAGPSFSVFSFNAGANAGGGRAASLLRAIRASDADVLALQEVPEATRAVLRQELASAYPYQIASAAMPDMLVFSQYPLSAAADLPPSRGAARGHGVAVDLGEQSVTLVSVHLSRPGYRLRWRGDLLPTIRAYDASGRDAQVTDLLAAMRQIPGPRLLVGDFNAGEWSHTYELLTEALDDSYAEAGWGFGHTYPSNIAWGNLLFSLPLLRIDYAFHSRDLVAIEARVGRDGGSDHLPIVARFAFR
jgi:endonuclease/exonuclease/phosphatase (EEP) superfamily protein YafD